MGVSVTWRPDTAMVLAAGLGTRMRPLTETVPKPLVRLAGRTLLDRVLDKVHEAGIPNAVVNVHYLAAQIIAHLEARESPRISISDERDALLDTGGGVKRAAALLGDGPVLICNSDTVWTETQGNIARLCAAWREAEMDCLLLLARAKGSLGYDGPGDFDRAGDGRLTRRPKGREAAHVFAGVSIMRARHAAAIAEDAFSLNRVWDDARARGRLFGYVLEGEWMHVGTPEALREAEARLAALGHG